ncbi:Mov34/MPN/PAD-1 family protein [Chryseobacterium sp. EO14]|uniref:Mov34/MPN/PAD-1 family protein n=1 Tax=Chryseobacterium sp. EO14 TaxID=2950551 RepID=UPI00210A463F|nr:Mov34/MPN/PAD-1 family protein [Chryseobacterium sp. EO14]MCQ4141607.1 Mov34/MPN/PAD-1 family protein [Chryseobacterium sp. EO14]
MKKQKFRITTEAYQNIIRKIGSQEPEKGGILMGKDGIVTDFIFDKEASTTRTTYSLNVAYLNPIIKELKLQGKQLMGIIHSHPNGYSKLSDPDRNYFSGQFENFPGMEFMYTPIVFSAKQDEFEIFPYLFHKNGTIEKAELEVVPNEYERYIIPEKNSKSNPKSKQKPAANARKELLVVIRENATLYADDKKDLSLSKANVLLLLMTGIYFFVLGICTGIFPVALMYIIKNNVDISYFLQHFIQTTH